MVILEVKQSEINWSALKMYNSLLMIAPVFQQLVPYLSITVTTLHALDSVFYSATL